jgi:hypothetical protein
MRALRNKNRDLHFGHSTSRIRDLFVSVITPTEPLGENPGTSQFVRISRNARCCSGVYQEKSYQPYRRRSRLYQQNQQGGCCRSLGLPRPCACPKRHSIERLNLLAISSQADLPRGRFHLREEADETLHGFLQSFAPEQASHASVRQKKTLHSSVWPKKLCPEQIGPAKCATPRTGCVTGRCPLR